jgi:hypothetical protein
MRFKHLETVKQTYIEHFIDSVRYSYLSFKASMYFLIHAIYPDIFTSAGSVQISSLHEEIYNKYQLINKKD